MFHTSRPKIPEAVLSLTLAMALGLSCAVDGPDVIEGSAANTRLQNAVWSKFIDCGTPLPFDFFFVIPGFVSGQSVFGGFRPNGYYRTADVDRCINDFNRLPCDQFRSTDQNDLVFPFLRLAASACPDVNENSFFKSPPGQGYIIRESDGSSSDD